MGLIDIDNIILSDVLKEGCRDKNLWDKIKNQERFLNPKDV